MHQLSKISVIIVAFNEELLINQIIAELKKQIYEGVVEIILADGGSNDDTVMLAKAEKIKIVTSAKKGKAIQMNAAAKKATGDILFFVHADMQFSNNLLNTIAETIHAGYKGGGFANEFDTYNKKIKRLGTWLNFRFFDKGEQSDKGIFYGDNGIFVKKNIFEELAGFKNIPIMEDYDFSKRLNIKHPTKKIRNPKIIVSARRHIKAGFLKTRLQWIIIRKLFEWGVPPKVLINWYKDIR